MSDLTAEYAPIARLSRDLKAASATLSHDEARYLVDAYYQMQDNRIRADGQIRAQAESDEPHAVLSWLATQNGSLEGQLRRALGAPTRMPTRSGDGANRLPGSVP